jgi:hypothetical protein
MLFGARVFGSKETEVFTPFASNWNIPIPKQIEFTEVRRGF